MIGFIDDDEYEFVRKGSEYPVAGYMRIMRTSFGHRVESAAVLEIENRFRSRTVKGSTIYNWLHNRGYGKATSRRVLRDFVSNMDLSQRMEGADLPEGYIRYGTTYNDRLSDYGIKGERYYIKRMLDRKIKVLPITEYEEILPPEIIEIPPEIPVELPPVPIVYTLNKFQVQASMAVSYRDKRGRKLSIFGEFWALVDEMDDAVEKALILLNDYAFVNGYGSLAEAGWVYNGVSTTVDFEEVIGTVKLYEKETSAEVWIDDDDYSRPGRFSDSMEMIPLWWRDSKFDIARRQFELSVQ